MQRSPDFDRVHDLIHHNTWVRGLALQLLNDRNQVDDVLQEVWITAMTRPPRSQEQRSERAWLAKVVRSLALKANRSQLRRRRWTAVPPRWCQTQCWHGLHKRVILGVCRRCLRQCSGSRFSSPHAKPREHGAYACMCFFATVLINMAGEICHMILACSYVGSVHNCGFLRRCQISIGTRPTLSPTYCTCFTSACSSHPHHGNCSCRCLGLLQCPRGQASSATSWTA